MRAVDRDFAAVTPREAPLTLSYYLRLVAVRWWIPVSLALLCACLSLVYTGLQSTTYQSRATTLLSPLDPATADEFTRLTPTVARLLRSDSVLLAARQAYLSRSPNADPLRTGPDELRARTGVIVPRDTTLFEVTAQGPSQRDASALVGSVVEAAARRVSALGARPTTRTGASRAPPARHLRTTGAGGQSEPDTDAEPRRGNQRRPAARHRRRVAAPRSTPGADARRRPRPPARRFRPRLHAAAVATTAP